MSYNHKEIEKNGKILGKTNTFNTHDDPESQIYALDMFPYPSGQGLHVGHPEGYTATDILSRVKEVKDTTCCIQWGGMHSVCLLNNMR